MDLVTGMQNADRNPAPRMGNQQAMATGHPPNAMNRAASKQANFALLIPVLEQQLDKDRAMQLQGLYVRLWSNYINKEEFVRHMKSLVGDHMLKMAVYKLEQGQLTAKSSMDNNAKIQQLLEHQSDSHGVQASHKFSNVNAIMHERDQQLMLFPKMNMSSQSFKQQTHDLQMRQGPVQTACSDMKRPHWQPSMHRDLSLMSSMAYAKQEPLDQTESSRDETFEMMPLTPGFSTSMNEPEPMPITERLSCLIQSAGNSSLAPGSNAKSLVRKLTLRQIKPKKRKVSGVFSDQSINQQLNDVTAVSGVNLRLEIVQAKLEKERKARQNIEARFEQFKQERAEREREREQERVEREREREQERVEREREREQERAEREQEREQELAEREQEQAEQAEW